ncbi:MAG: helix-turn-helix transcriptional regulator [Ferruginibacter sp.]
MRIEDYIPTEQLRPFIKTYKIIESQDEIVNRVLPNTSLAIAFRVKGQTNYILGFNHEHLPTSTISGLRKTVRLINYCNDTITIVVLFKETGASAFFRQPLYELFEESVSLDNYIPKQKVLLVEEKLAEALNNNQRIDIIEQFLISQLCNFKTDHLIANAVDKIYSMKGIVKIKELANTLYISNDSFEKRFRKIAGTTPKQFSSIVRMKSVISQKQQNQNIADIAFNAGYFDQPNFNKDFKLFTGQTPTDFFKSSSFW